MNDLWQRMDNFLDLVDDCEEISPSGRVDARFKDLANDSADLVRMIFLTKEGKDAFHRVTVNVKLTEQKFKDMLNVKATVRKRYDPHCVSLFRTLREVDRTRLCKQLSGLSYSLKGSVFLVSVREEEMTTLFGNLSGKVEVCRGFGHQAYVNSYYWHNIAKLLLLDEEEFNREENLEAMTIYEDELLDIIDDFLPGRVYQSTRELILDYYPELKEEFAKDGIDPIRSDDINVLRKLYGVSDAESVESLLRSKSWKIDYYG